LNNNKQQISVVLRTPHTTSNVTQEIQNSVLYNTIERKLMSAGFVVRDRALLEKLLVNEQLSYESIAQKVKADLIIEVIEFSRQDIYPSKMIRIKDNKEVSIKHGHDKIYFATYKFMFRIVLLESGASGGFLTSYYNCCSNGCKIYAEKWGGYYWLGRSVQEIKSRRWMIPTRIETYGWSCDSNDDIEYYGSDLSNKLINILKGKY
jgi:hypothetical protein